MISTNAIMFAIQGAVKLGAQARAAYADAARRQELVLPLPNFNPEPSIAPAMDYFELRDAQIDAPPYLRQLMDKIKNGLDLTEDEKTDLMDFHMEFLLQDFVRETGYRRTEDGSKMDVHAVEALCTIRQWRRGHDPHPTALKRLGGTFLEIGIDYFTQVPGGLDLNSRSGRALHALLSGFDKVDFVTEPLGELPAQLFTATMEVVSGNTDLFTDDPKIQELIGDTALSLAKDVSDRIDEIRQGGGGTGNEEKEGKTRIWAEVVFRSVLSSAGMKVAADPKRYFGIQHEGKSALVSSVCQATMGLILDQPLGDMEAAFSRQGLEMLIDTALDVVERHPELVSGDKNELSTLVAQIAKDLAAFDALLDSAVLPDVARVILDRTAENLELFWPDREEHPERQLALIATKTVLEVLSREPQDGEPWRPRFSHDDIVEVVEDLLDELLSNPHWLIDAVGDVDPDFGVTIEAMMNVLRQRGTANLDAELGLEMLKAGVRAIAMRSEFLERVTDDSPPVVAAAMDAVLSVVLNPDLDRKVIWRLGRREVVLGLYSVALEEMERSTLTPQVVALLDQVLADQVNAIANGEPWDLDRFSSDLATVLAQ